MTTWPFFVAGSLAIAAGIAWVKWTTQRRRLPMPPLPLRNPRHDRPDKPLTDCERVKFDLLAESFQDRDLVADDPMEQL